MASQLVRARADSVGSMPPNSKELWQEGGAMKSFLLVENGLFDEKGITKILKVDPAQYEGCVGTRTLKDNISDLKAQVSANQRGIMLVALLIKEYGLRVVQAYMYFIQENASLAVSELFRTTASLKGSVLRATEYMDDGSPIQLTITINGGKALFDFEGTGEQVLLWNNA